MCQTLQEEEVGPVIITRPSGDTLEIKLDEVSPGRFEMQYFDPEIGLYRLKEGEHSALIGFGPAAPREFERTIAADEVLSPVLADLRRGVIRVEDGLPAIRNVCAGRPAAGRAGLV